MVLIITPSLGFCILPCPRATMPTSSALEGRKETGMFLTVCSLITAVVQLPLIERQQPA